MNDLRCLARRFLLRLFAHVSPPFERSDDGNNYIDLKSQYWQPG
nr:L308 [uncultured bacterium]